MISRLPRTTLVALACTLVLAACTSDAERRTEYQRELRGVGASVTDALDDVPSDNRATIGPDQIRTLAERLRSAAGDLDDLDPPDDAQRPQARMVRGLRGVADAYDGLADDLAVAKTDDARAERFVEFASDERTDRAFDDLASAQDAYGSAGYRVFAEPLTRAVPNTNATATATAPASAASATR